MSNILLIGDSRDCPNYGAIGTTEMLLKCLQNSEKKHEIRTITWRSLNSKTPIGGWEQSASESINRFKYDIKERTLKNRLKDCFEDTLLLDGFRLIKKSINRMRGYNDGFGIHEYHVPYKFSDFEEFSKKVLNGECLQYEKFMIEWADIVVINGEGSIVKGTDKNGYYHVGGLYILYMAYFSKKIFGKETYMINHTVDPQNRDIYYMIENIYPMLDAVYVREPLSLEILEKQCNYNRARFVPDALFSYSDNENWEPTSCIKSQINFNEPYICVGDTSGFYTDKNSLFDVEKMYDELIRKLRNICPQIVFIVGFGKYYSPEMEVIRKNKMPYLCIHNSSYVDLYHVLKNAKIFISGRWHTSILSLKAKTPILLFGSDSHKTEALYYMLDYPYRFFDFRTLALNVDEIVSEVKKIIDSDNEPYFKKAEDLAKDAKNNMDFLSR